MTKRWLGKELVESELNPGHWRWFSGETMLTICLCEGWWVAQVSTVGFIETSRRKRTERAARAEVERSVRLIAAGVVALSSALADGGKKPVRPPPPNP